MSYYHPTEMHPALQRHLIEADHRLVTDPVSLAADGTVPALQFHGGPTIAHPRVVALYSGRFWGDRAKNDQFLRDITENGYLSLGAAQGFGNGTFLGSFDIPAPASGVVTDTDCQAMIALRLGKNGVPQPDASTIYLLILPDGVQSRFTAGGSDASCVTYCAYHSSAPTFLYTVQPANTCGSCNQGNPQDGLQMTEAHELAEACSDPRGSGWFNDSTGQENADEVAWVQRQFGPYTVQGYACQDATGRWINGVGPYVQPTPQPKPDSFRAFLDAFTVAVAWDDREEPVDRATAVNYFQRLVVVADQWAAYLKAGGQ